MFNSIQILIVVTFCPLGTFWRKPRLQWLVKMAEYLQNFSEMMSNKL